MRDYQRELKELRERIAGRRENIAVLERLQEQEVFWQQEVAQRQAQWDREQRDVDRLERVSLSSVWASLRGSKEDDLDREKAEAAAARFKLQEAERQLDEIRFEIRDRQDRVDADADCETRYETVLLEKEQEYRAKDPALAARLADIEQRELQIVSRHKELQEAINAGDRALFQIDAALEKLSDAESWSALDLFGGGLLTDMMKYSNMDEAQYLMERVQSDLWRYRAELADVAQTVSFDLQSGSVLRMADYFFDNIFTDWAVRDRIMQTGYELQEVADRVRRIQDGLIRDLKKTEQELIKLQNERAEAVRLA